MTEARLLELRDRLRVLISDISRARPAVAACDDAWDNTLASLDEAASAFGLAIYLATEALADEDDRAAGVEIER